MALGAYSESARTSVDPVAAFERLHRFEGVTGTYSFAGGRLTRDFFAVKIFEGALHPVDADFLGASPAGARELGRDRPPASSMTRCPEHCPT